MEGFDLSLGSLATARKGLRRKRPLPLDQEQAAAEPRPAGERTGDLSGYVPSALIPTERRAAALIAGGPPAWSRRLRRIDTLIDEARTELESVWRQLAATHARQPARFASTWRARAAEADFSRVNELIRRHNLYFPAEARLAMDVRTRDYIGIGGGDYRRRPLDAAWVLEHFPDEIEAALGAGSAAER